MDNESFKAAPGEEHNMLLVSTWQETHGAAGHPEEKGREGGTFRE